MIKFIKKYLDYRKTRKKLKKGHSVTFTQVISREAYMSEHRHRVLTVAHDMIFDEMKAYEMKYDVKLNEKDVVVGQIANDYINNTYTLALKARL